MRHVKYSQRDDPPKFSTPTLTPSVESNTWRVSNKSVFQAKPTPPALLNQVSETLVSINKYSHAFTNNNVQPSIDELHKSATWQPE